MASPPGRALSLTLKYRRVARCKKPFAAFSSRFRTPEAWGRWDASCAPCPAHRPGTWDVQRGSPGHPGKRQGTWEKHPAAGCSLLIPTSPAFPTLPASQVSQLRTVPAQRTPRRWDKATRVGTQQHSLRILLSAVALAPRTQHPQPPNPPHQPLGSGGGAYPTRALFGPSSALPAHPHGRDGPGRVSPARPGGFPAPRISPRGRRAPRCTSPPRRPAVSASPGTGGSGWARPPRDTACRKSDRRTRSPAPRGEGGRTGNAACPRGRGIAGPGSPPGVGRTDRGGRGSWQQLQPRRRSCP